MTALTFTTKLFRAIHQQNVSLKDFEVLIAIKNGDDTTYKIASYCGVSYFTIKSRLKPLMNNALVTKTDNTHYKLTMFGDQALTRIFNFLND